MKRKKIKELEEKKVKEQQDKIEELEGTIVDGKTQIQYPKGRREEN